MCLNFRKSLEDSDLKLSLNNGRDVFASSLKKCSYHKASTCDGRGGGTLILPLQHVEEAVAKQPAVVIAKHFFFFSALKERKNKCISNRSRSIPSTSQAKIIMLYLETGAHHRVMRAAGRKSPGRGDMFFCAF